MIVPSVAKGSALDVAIHLHLGTPGFSASSEAQTVDCKLQTVTWGAIERTNALSSSRVLDSKREYPKKAKGSAVHDVRWQLRPFVVMK